MSDYTFDDAEADELAGKIWAVEDTFDDDTSDETKSAVADLHAWLAAKAVEKGVSVPQQRGGTPKGENPPPPPPPGG